MAVKAARSARRPTPPTTANRRSRGSRPAMARALSAPVSLSILSTPIVAPVGIPIARGAVILMRPPVTCSPGHPSQSFVNAGLNCRTVPAPMAEALMEPQCKSLQARIPHNRGVRRSMTAGAAREPSFGVLVGLAWFVIATDLIVRNWAGTALTLGDTDDAMRLVPLRDFLGGQGWFDLHQPRLAPPLGYDSHWSRLIDTGLAGLFRLFHHFADA